MLPSNDFMRLVMFEGNTHCVWSRSVCDALTWMFCVFTGWTQTLNVRLCIVTNRSNKNPNDLTTGTTLWLGSICAPNPPDLLISEAKIINNQIKRHKMHNLMEMIITCRDAKSQLTMTRWHEDTTVLNILHFSYNRFSVANWLSFWADMVADDVMLHDVIAVCCISV